MIVKVFIMACFCFGVYKASRPGMLLGKIASFSSDKLGWLNKPLFGCIYCMASIWGTISYVLIQLAYKEPFNIAEWLVLIVACISVNAFIYNSIESE